MPSRRNSPANSARAGSFTSLATGTELRIELHDQANPAHAALREHLWAERNRTETHYPAAADSITGVVILGFADHPLRGGSWMSLLLGPSLEL